MKNKEYKLPEIVKALLKENKITQARLAEDINVTLAAVQRWLHFRSVPDVFNVIELADYFNVSIDYLIFGDKGE